MEQNMNEMIQKAKHHDEDALKYLYDETIRNSYYITKKFISDEETCSDIIQDAYVTAFQKLDTLRDEDRFPQWVARIVTNRTIDHLRKMGKTPIMVSMDKPLSDDEDTTFVESLADEDWTFQPADQFSYSELKQAMQELIQELPQDQRICILMHYYEQFSVAEIAEALGVSSNTVKSRLSYGKIKIKDKIETLEKKGVKLYSVTPIPVLLWFFQGEVANVVVPSVLLEGTALTSASIGLTSATSIAGSSAITVGKAVVSKVILTKIAIAATAVVVVGGGGYGVYQATKPQSPTVTNSTSKTPDTASSESAEKQTFKKISSKVVGKFEEVPLLFDDVYVIKINGKYGAVKATNTDWGVQPTWNYFDATRLALFQKPSSNENMFMPGVSVHSKMFGDEMELGGIGGATPKILSKTDSGFAWIGLGEVTSFDEGIYDETKKDKVFMAFDEGDFDTYNGNPHIYLVKNNKQIDEGNYRDYYLLVDRPKTITNDVAPLFGLKKDKETTMYNDNGKKLGTYENVAILSNEYYSVKDGKQISLYDKEGTLYFRATAEAISAPYQDTAYIKVDGSWIYVSLK